jgi:CBS domain containing-hemolysin-like protein
MVLPTLPRWIWLHAICMILSFALVMPLSIAIVRYRRSAITLLSQSLCCKKSRQINVQANYIDSHVAMTSVAIGIMLVGALVAFVSV